MFNLHEVENYYQSDIDAVNEWCQEMYKSKFATYFTQQDELYKRLKSTSRPITDEELETILTTLPLELYSVAESLNTLRVSQELIKLGTKKREADISKHSNATTATGRAAEAAVTILGDKLLSIAYSAVITRVDSQCSFSRELIMGAKKIWDSRHRALEMNPVAPVDTSSELPNYSLDSAQKNTYIR